MNEEIKENHSQNISHNTPEKSFFRELLEIALIVIIVLLPIRYFIAQPFIVVGTSMYPTFSNGDYLIIDELSYRFEKPQRGDIIVFRPPVDLKEHYIKRIVGLPGETVSVNGNTVTIKNAEHPNGFTLDEKYVSSERDGVNQVTLGPDEYYVMGDNRSVSSDSRVWGPLKASEISGRVLVRLFPFQSIGVLPGKVSE